MRELASRSTPSLQRYTCTQLSTETQLAKSIFFCFRSKHKLALKLELAYVFLYVVQARKFKVVTLRFLCFLALGPLHLLPAAMHTLILISLLFFYSQLVPFCLPNFILISFWQTKTPLAFSSTPSPSSELPGLFP